MKSLRDSITKAAAPVLPITVTENDSIFPSMSYQQRAYGFGICFVAGWVVVILSFSQFTALILGKLQRRHAWTEELVSMMIDQQSGL